MAKNIVSQNLGQIWWLICWPQSLLNLKIQNPFNTFVFICTRGTRDFWLNPLPSEYHLGFLGLFWTALPMHCGLIPQQQTSRCWSCSVTEVSKIKKTQHKIILKILHQNWNMVHILYNVTETRDHGHILNHCKKSVCKYNHWYIFWTLKDV